MLNRLFKIISSLRLTVVCLGFGVLLVFVGTLAQVHEGLYQAQARFFKSWVIFGLRSGPDSTIPLILPGGYLLGTVLLVNLLAAHFARFKFTRKKTGIFIIHLGVILLLLGQLLTDVLSSESAMRLTPGESKNYSEDFHGNELVLIDTSATNRDTVMSISEGRLARGGDIHDPQLPVTVRVRHYWPNAQLLGQPLSNAVPAQATEGVGKGLYVLSEPPVTTMEDRNMPAATVDLLTSGGQSLGTWLVSSRMGAQQSFTQEGRKYNLAMRFLRHYEPYSVTLLDTKHDLYAGTRIPKNYQSRIRVENPETRENREVDIYMNNPLRYAGKTFYQFQMSTKETEGEEASVFQVVHNPSWLTPYFACVMVGAGLVIQFLTHLIGFAMKRRAA